jgi:hypothetical protein
MLPPTLFAQPVTGGDKEDNNSHQLDRVVPQSRSLIMRSTHILKIKIIDSSPSSWEKIPERALQERTTSIDLMIIEQLKGELKIDEKEAVSIKVKQYEGINLWRIPIPGVWSEKALDAGTEYLLFCQSLSADGDGTLDATNGSDEKKSKGNIHLPAEVFSEDNTLSVLSVNDYEFDVRLVVTAERKKSSMQDLLEKAAGHPEELNHLFAEYTETRIGELIFQDIKVFGQWILLQESPDLELTTRVMLIEALLHELGLSDPGPIEYYRAAVISLFHVLRMPASKFIQANIVQSYLPNILGLNGGVSFKSSGQIFKGNPKEKGSAVKWLEENKNLAGTDELLKWINK